jgi:hypothetical protein
MSYVPTAIIVVVILSSLDMHREFVDEDVDDRDEELERIGMQVKDRAA